MTYCYELNDINEANYLISLLNSPVVNELIKPMQSKGLWGPRHIHKKVLELPIPKYDEKNTIHMKCSALGKECNRKVGSWLSQKSYSSTIGIGKLRGEAREMLEDELKQINELVKQILS